MFTCCRQIFQPIFSQPGKSPLEIPCTYQIWITWLGKKTLTRFGEFCYSSFFHFRLALPAAFMQPGDHLLANPCGKRTLFKCCKVVDPIMPLFCTLNLSTLFESSPVPFTHLVACKLIHSPRAIGPLSPRRALFLRGGPLPLNRDSGWANKINCAPHHRCISYSR